MKLAATFWGVRGGFPVPGKETVEFGGNTTCLQVQAGPNLIILDAGRVCVTGSPQELMQNTKQLENCHLSLPPVYKTLAILQQTHPEIHTGVSSVDEAVAEVMQHVRG